MDHLRRPYRVNVGFLIHQPIGTYNDFSFNFPIALIPPDLEVTDFVGTIRFNRTPQGLLSQGNFSGSIKAECVRCLDEFSQLINIQFQELYTFRQNAGNDSSMVIPEDGNIDLSPVLREYFFLEFPINPLCKPDCKGLCLECGENWNHKKCEHFLENLYSGPDTG